MPRVVANQRERFDNDELFRKLSRDMEASMANGYAHKLINRSNNSFHMFMNYKWVKKDAKIST